MTAMTMRMILRRRRYLEELGRRTITMFADGRDTHGNTSSLIPYFSYSVCSVRSFHPLSRSMRAVKVDKKSLTVRVSSSASPVDRSRPR